MFRSVRSWHLISLVAVGLLAPCANADIVSLGSAKSCSGQNDPACNHGQAYSLQSILNGTTSLSSFYSGTTTQGFYLVQNDVSNLLSSFSVTLTGSALPANHFLTCQVNGYFSGDTCSITGPSGTVGTGAQYGPIGQLPATLTFSGLSLASGQEFEFTFASFGQNDTTTALVPEPPEWMLLLVSSGAVIVGGIYIRFRRPAVFRLA